MTRDVCAILGIQKLNTTAYHPACNGMVERFNRTLKTALRKHADRFGCQWDRYLAGILWGYRNTLHDTTGEKPSFLLFGNDLRAPTDAAFLSPSSVANPY
jgi:transposase InsO family protein